MIAAWILYAIVVGALIGASGLAVEQVLRTHRLPARWIWTGTILLSVGWPLGHWAWENMPPARPAAAAPASPEVALPEMSVAAVPLETIAVAVPAESVLRLLDGPIIAAWALATGILLVFFGFLFFQARSMRAQWPKGEASGRAVLFANDWGPAVVGFIRPQIVLPGWCRDIDAWALRFILDHELEHVRAGDLRLMILAGVIPVLFPWHLPVWWQLSRLRTAIEGDCDLRVLGKNRGQTKAYVDLLLEVGEKSSRGRAAAAMLSEPYETLKRRIKIMTTPVPKNPRLKGGLLAAVGAVLVGLACWAPGPTDGQDGLTEPPAESVLQGEIGIAQEGTMTPSFTPYSVQPAVKNVEQVLAALKREYPPALRDAGTGGTVAVYFFIDEDGMVQDTRIDQSSGHPALDDAALKVASLYRFSPALNRDMKVPVWVSFAIEFTTDDTHEEGIAERRPEVVRPRETAAPLNAPTRAARGTGEITGTITGAGTGQPIGFVQVFVSGTGRGTLSDEDGRFLIRNVPAGVQEVVAHLIGYGELSKRVSVAAEGSANTDFGLQPTAIALPKLVVKGTE